MLTLYFLSGLLLICIYLFLKSCYKLMKLLPSTKSIKKITNITKIGKPEKDLIDKLVGYTDMFVKKLFSEYDAEGIQRKEIEQKLLRIGSKDTYERFVAKQYLYPVLSIILGFFIGAMFNSIPMMSYMIKGIGFISAILLYFDPKLELNKQLREKNERIILEMPRFIRTYRYSPETKGLHEIIKDYLKTAKSGLFYDLTLLLADIEMVGEEAALKNFADRVNIAEVNEFVTVLLTSLSSTKKEADMNLFFIESKFQESINTIIDKELKKRPEILDTINEILLQALAILIIAPMAIYSFQGIVTMMK